VRKFTSKFREEIQTTKKENTCEFAAGLGLSDSSSLRSCCNSSFGLFKPALASTSSSSLLSFNSYKNIHFDVSNQLNFYEECVI